MRPVTLRTERLVLDQPTSADVDLMTTYCQDPIFESFMLTPWPYQRCDAEVFIEHLIPEWWQADREFTWALRLANGHPSFLGVIGYRAEGKDVGFWLGAPHRGNGYMPEALRAVLDWVFDAGGDSVRWECVPGNLASAAVARKVGFTFTGESTSMYVDRNGERSTAWTGAISAESPRSPTEGWPG